MPLLITYYNFRNLPQKEMKNFLDLVGWYAVIITVKVGPLKHLLINQNRNRKEM